MKINNVSILNNVFLAPMAEYTNLAFRLLAREFGASLVYTEMAMAKAVARQDRKELRLLRTKSSDKPAVAQLCGREPEDFAEAVRTVEAMGYVAVDLNLCCPIKRIDNQRAGGVLMREPALIEKIVRAMVHAGNIPVTVKICSGADDMHRNAEEIATVCEQSGASAVAVHPRTVEQGYIGASDWSIIEKIKQKARIPIIGSGDIRDPKDVKAMIAATGCDAVMVARGCLGRPWFFRQSIHLLGTDSLLPPPSSKQIKQIMLHHFDLVMEQGRKDDAVPSFRRHLPYYAKAMGKENDFGKAVRNIRTIREFENAVREWL